MSRLWPGRGHRDSAGDTSPAAGVPGGGGAVPHAAMTAQAAAYADLSRQAAAAGDGYLAIHAAWASDINTVQAVTWEQMAGTPGPDDRFVTVAAAVSRAVTSPGFHPVGDAAATVLASRDGLTAAVDPSTRRRLTARYCPVDHLRGLPVPSGPAAVGATRRRLVSQPVEEATATLRRVAADCMRVAVGMHQAGRDTDAIRLAYHADMATVATYLLEAATAVGDASFVLVDLRWAVICQAISGLPGIPTTFPDAVDMIRAAVTGAVNPSEAARLTDRFLPVG